MRVRLISLIKRPLYLFKFSCLLAARRSDLEEVFQFVVNLLKDVSVLGREVLHKGLVREKIFAHKVGGQFRINIGILDVLVKFLDGIVAGLIFTLGLGIGLDGALQFRVKLRALQNVGNLVSYGGLPCLVRVHIQRNTVLGLKAVDGSTVHRKAAFLEFRIVGEIKRNALVCGNLGNHVHKFVRSSRVIEIACINGFLHHLCLRSLVFGCVSRKLLAAPPLLRIALHKVIVALRGLAHFSCEHALHVLGETIFQRIPLRIALGLLDLRVNLHERFAQLVSPIHLLTRHVTLLHLLQSVKLGLHLLLLLREGIFAVHGVTVGLVVVAAQHAFNRVGINAAFLQVLQRFIVDFVLFLCGQVLALRFALLGKTFLVNLVKDLLLVCGNARAVVRAILDGVGDITHVCAATKHRTADKCLTVCLPGFLAKKTFGGVNDIGIH